MKRVWVIAGVIAAGLFAGCYDERSLAKKSGSGVLFRSHFAGRAALNQGTNATRLRAIDALPETPALKKAFARKLAAAAVEFWKNDRTTDATAPSALLEPLLEDLLVGENCVEVRGPAGKTETAVAIELSDDRARLWSTNLWQLAAVFKFGVPRLLENGNGWETRRDSSPNLFRFARAGKWVLVGLSHNKSGTFQSFVEQATRSGRPLPALTNEFLEVNADLPGLSRWFPIFAQYPFPTARCTVARRGENLRTEAQLQWKEKVPWTTEPWRIPTNLVTEPLTSFTVARGIAPWLERVRDFPELGLKPTPNQICTWGISNDQPRVFFTLPVADATNVMRQLAPIVPRLILRRVTNALGNFIYVSNRTEIAWSLPYIGPYLRPAVDAGSEFLFGGIFPPPSNTYPVPDELYAQVRGRTNLLYYDWEDTPQRLDHSRYMYQLASIVSQRALPEKNSVSQRWLIAMRPKLGNTVTEITQTGPRELFLVRKSQVGLTGFELATFSAWLESPGFPFRLELPPPLPRRATNAPPAAIPRKR